MYGIGTVARLAQVSVRTFRNGDRATSFDRELYIDCDGSPETWATELQAILQPEPSAG